MTLEELETRLLENQERLAALLQWADHADRRLGLLEKAQDTLANVRISLTKLDSTTERIGEKLTDMKKTLDRIDDDAQTRHEELSRRVRALEDAPGKKWDKAVWLIISLVIGAVVGYFLQSPVK
jgi:chromosome segregation ATPase